MNMPTVRRRAARFRLARGCARRRGFAYLLVLVTTLFVSVVGVGAVKLALVKSRAEAGVDDMLAARAYANAAIEIGFTMIAQDESWRSNLGNGTWVATETIGLGRLRLVGTYVDDGDGHNVDDDVILTGVGMQGDSTHMTQVTLTGFGNRVTVSPGSWRQSVNN